MIINILILLSSFQVNAVEIVDNWNVLSELRTPITFENAFTCNQPVYVYKGFEEVSCTNNFCKSSHVAPEGKSMLVAEDCNANSLNIYGDQGLQFSVTKSEYTSAGQNWVIPFLQGIGQFFNAEPTMIELNMLIPAKATFVHDGIKEQLMIREVILDVYFQEGSMAFELIMYFNPRGKGFDQILQLSDNDDILYKRKGVFIEQIQ